MARIATFEVQNPRLSKLEFHRNNAGHRYRAQGRGLLVRGRVVLHQYREQALGSRPGDGYSDATPHENVAARHGF